jgi:hypothetical protein
LLIEPMTALSWSDALEQALSAYGYSWESTHLRELVARDIARTASAMPLVQFALQRLWEGRDEARKVLTARAFRQMGGVTGALAQHADATLASVSRELPDGESLVRSVLLVLTTPQGTRAVRERAEIERLTEPGAGRVLEVFEAARLVVRLPTGYTLAHESVLAEWPRLHAWMVAARGARTLVEELEHDAQRFAADPDGVPVWRKRRLGLALESVANEGLTLSDRGQAFLQAGLRAESRRRRALWAALVTALALTVGGAALYLRAVEEERGRTQAALERERESRELAEARTREVQRAQARIDELLADMGSSPAKSEVLALQAQILDAPPVAQAPAAPKVRSVPKDPPAPAEARPVEQPRLRVQSEW